MSLINCNECGKEISDNTKSCPNCGNPINKSTKDKWATTKLTVGIVSIFFALAIFFELCLIFFASSDSGLVFFLCAILMFAGITSIATRKSADNGGAIAAVIQYWIATVFYIITYINYCRSYKSFVFLSIGIVTFCFGLVNLCSIFARAKMFQNKEKHNLLYLFANCVSILAYITILVNIVIFINPRLF